MVKVVRFFAYILFFFIALIYFMPKENLYFLGEKELQKYHVVVDNESVEDRGFSLELRHLHLYVESIESATIESVDLKLFGLYNRVNVHTIILSKAVASMFPTKIDRLSMEYSILDPLHVILNGVGAFGTLHGVVNLRERKVIVDVKPSSVMQKEYKSALRYFKKEANGEYEYVQSF